jgi:4-hydroxy-tetrahydrodipicolinate reductase
MAIRLGVLGATGKMGKRVLALASQNSDFSIGSAWTHPHSKHLSKEGALESDIDVVCKNADILIDFSIAAATLKILESALKWNKPLVIGVTGHSALEQTAIQNAAKKIPILYSANFSLGMAACLEVAKLFASKLRQDCRIKIVETHHIHKKDSPSGTALALAAAMRPHTPEPQIQSVRLGEVIGTHTVTIECEGETIELAHSVQSRDTFAKGALQAAKFLHNQKPGLYTLRDL